MFALSELQAHLTVTVLWAHIVARGPALPCERPASHAREDAVPEGREADVPRGKEGAALWCVGAGAPPYARRSALSRDGLEGMAGGQASPRTGASTTRGITP